MNVVILDGFTLNPGDLSWEELQSLGPCTIYDRTSPAEVASRAADADISVTVMQIVALASAKEAGILTVGGTILGTTNRGNPLCCPVEQPDGTVVEVKFPYSLDAEAVPLLAAARLTLDPRAEARSTRRTPVATLDLVVEPSGTSVLEHPRLPPRRP